MYFKSVLYLICFVFFLHLQKLIIFSGKKKMPIHFVTQKESDDNVPKLNHRVRELEAQLAAAQAEVTRWQTVNNQLLGMVYDGDDDDNDATPAP